MRFLSRVSLNLVLDIHSGYFAWILFLGKRGGAFKRSCRDYSQSSLPIFNLQTNDRNFKGKRITSEELLQTGFVNKIFNCGKTEDAKFRSLVMQEVDERLGTHLVSDSLTEMKKLIRRPERAIIEGQGVAEVMKGLERFVAGM